MKKHFFSLAAVAATVLTSSCGTVVSTIGIIRETAISGRNLGVLVGSDRTAYEFEVTGVTNDGGIPAGRIVQPTADIERKAEYRDDLVDLIFCYSSNCFRLGFRNRGNRYLAINWNDIIMDGSQKLFWKDARNGLSTITPAAFNEAYLYVSLDRLSGICRSLPVFISQKKADEAGVTGRELTFTCPVIQGEKVVTYSVRVRIVAVKVL